MNTRAGHVRHEDPGRETLPGDQRRGKATAFISSENRLLPGSRPIVRR
jgi:hypothetical protein